MKDALGLHKIGVAECALWRRKIGPARRMQRPANKGRDMPQAEDMEMKGWVVRSDVGTNPTWLKLNIMKARTNKFAVSDELRVAHVFDDFDEAQGVADDWSDAPGVWHVERL